MFVITPISRINAHALLGYEGHFSEREMFVITPISRINAHALLGYEGHFSERRRCL